LSTGSEDWRPLKTNVRNLINDFLEAYSIDPEEVMVIESIANSLDAGAQNIWISLKRTTVGDVFSITDDGKGMTKGEFEDSYHALALSSKEKGGTIGFAGVGGKLYLVMLEAGNSIYTETKSSTFHGASLLTMVSDDAKWKPVPIRGRLIGSRGTHVELILRPGRLDYPTVERIIQDNYNAILLGLYGEKSIHLSWRPHTPLEPWKPDLESEHHFSFKVDGKTCDAYFWLAKEEFEGQKGLDLVILGKRIKANQWFDVQFDIKPDFSKRVCGLVTADPLAKLLTTNKQDLKVVGREKTWKSFKEQINKGLLDWLTDIGAVREISNAKSEELAAASEVSEMINRILKLPDLKVYNPYFRRTISDAATKSDGIDSFIKEIPSAQGVPGTLSDGKGERTRAEGSEQNNDFVSSDEGSELGERVTRRLRSGINVNIVDSADVEEEAWVAKEAVVVNRGNKVYKKFQNQGYSHEVSNMFRIVATALIENADPNKKQAFDELRKFYKSWATQA
jgi:hypothetical protein